MLLECKGCSATVDSKIISVYEERGVADPENYEPPGRWTFVSCPRCQMPMLALQCDHGEGFEDDSPVRMYPPRERQLSWKVPQSIKKAFNEAVTCFRVKAYTASAIMCRKTLEGLCAEHGVKGPNLSVSLKRLRDKQIIEARLFDWAEALRTMGNEAAHGVESAITREDCQDTLDFTEALVQYVFTYQDQFQKFSARRQNGSDKSVIPSSVAGITAES
jgi:hypothetical protein